MTITIIWDWEQGVMREFEHQPGPSRFRTPIEKAIAAIVGLSLGALSLLIFVFDLLVTPEMGALMVSFVVCGIGLTTAIMILRRLTSPREPLSLFAGLSSFPSRPKPQAETCAQGEQLSRDCPEPAMSRARNNEGSILNNSRHKNISSYTARESSGAMCLIMAIGVSLILGSRLSGGWQFLALALPAGFLVALALYLVRQKQNSSLDTHTIPVAGGVVGIICMTGLGIVMIRSNLLRDFFGLAVGAGGAVALLLSRARRKEGSDISLV
jgi:hypothetical protein